MTKLSVHKVVAAILKPTTNKIETIKLRGKKKDIGIAKLLTCWYSWSQTRCQGVSGDEKFNIFVEGSRLRCFECGELGQIRVDCQKGQPEEEQEEEATGKKEDKEEKMGHKRRKKVEAKKQKRMKSLCTKMKKIKRKQKEKR